MVSSYRIPIGQAIENTLQNQHNPSFIDALPVRDKCKKFSIKCKYIRFLSFFLKEILTQ